MIYIDISAAVHGRAGLGRYAKSLAQELIEIAPDRFSLFYNMGSDARVPTSLTLVPQRHISLGYKPWRMLVYFGNLLRLSYERFIPNARLIHCTEHLLMPARNIPTVLTVHDLIFKLFPEHHKRLNYWYLNQAMPLYCRRATKIIAISEATKRDVVEYYDIDASKIHVVYEAAAPHFKPAAPEDIRRVREKYALPENFLLHISTIEPRKNLDRLVEALLILRNDFPDLTLVLVGAKGWLVDEFFQRIESRQLAGVVRALGWVEDEDLPGVIGAASLAVQPSLYEGFGLPILEHMACGQVVAASSSSSHPEVGGEAASYFEPEDLDQIVAVIRGLLINEEEYQQRQVLGIKQAAKFTWKAAASETIAIYDQVITEAGR